MPNILTIILLEVTIMDLYEELRKCFPAMELLYNHDFLMEFMNTPSYELLKYLLEFAPVTNDLLREDGILYKLFTEKGINNKTDMQEIPMTGIFTMFFLVNWNICTTNMQFQSPSTVYLKTNWGKNRHFCPCTNIKHTNCEYTTRSKSSETHPKYNHVFHRN